VDERIYGLLPFAPEESLFPTPRWTAYDAKYFGIKMPAEISMTTTERAYTSLIWYTP
jgi:hypothetical protein